MSGQALELPGRQAAQQVAGLRRRQGIQQRRLAVRLERRQPEVLQGVDGFAEDVVEVVVGLVVQRLEGRESRRLRFQIAQTEQGFQAGPRKGILGAGGQDRQGIVQFAPPEAGDPGRRRAGPRFGGVEHAAEQFRFDDVQVLMEPQGFQAVVLQIGEVRGVAAGALARVDIVQPRLGRGQHFVARPLPEFAADAVAGAVLVALQQPDELRRRGAGDLGRLEQRPGLVPYPPDTAVVVIAALVPERVLHVADQRVEPVDDVERAVRGELQVDGPEIDVGRVEERLDLFRGEARVLLDHPVLLDALEADRVVDQEVALRLVREVAGTHDLAAGGRPDDRGEDLHPPPLRRVGRVAGDRGAEVVRAAGGVGDEVLTPSVEDVAPGIGEGVGDEDLEVEAVRLVAEDAGIDQPHRAVGCLDLAVVEHALLEVERAAGSPGEGGDRVVAVLGAEAVQDDLVAVGHVVAVRVLDEHQVRLLGHVDAAVAEFEAGRYVQAAGEHGVVIGPAVAVTVFENHDLVVGFLVR